MTAQAVTVAEPMRPQLVAGGKMAAIIPQTMDEAYRMAKAVCMAGMAPRGMDTPEKAMIAIMRGMEVGLTPFQALDKIAVVNGRPTIWGDGAMALVRGSGLCEFIRESIDGDGEKAVAVCRAKRRGEIEPIVGTFSVEDAKKAGLWGKSGPWQQFPKRMLQMRARAFALRDGFADVLGGLYLREELDDAAPPRDAPKPPAPPPAPVANVAKIAPPPPPATAPAPAPANRLPPPPPPPPPPAPISTTEDIFERFRSELQMTGHTQEESNAIFERVVAANAQLSDEDQAELEAILHEHCAIFWQDQQ